MKVILHFDSLEPSQPSQGQVRFVADGTPHHIPPIRGRRKTSYAVMRLTIPPPKGLRRQIGFGMLTSNQLYVV
jgi:hypothetical protein